MPLGRWPGLTVACGVAAIEESDDWVGRDRRYPAGDGDARLVRLLERKQSSIVRIRTAKYATPGLNDLLEWTTTLLPSHSWLSEFQLSQPDDKMGEQQINISGFSEGAASLVGLFDASPYFNDATLTSPISLDPVEARERFSMQMRVRKPRSEKSSTP